MKPQSNGPLYSNTVIGTLAVDGGAHSGWDVTFGTAMRRLDRAAQPAQAPPCCVPNVTATHQKTASVPITVLLYNGPLLCGFNVPLRVN